MEAVLTGCPRGAGLQSAMPSFCHHRDPRSEQGEEPAATCLPLLEAPQAPAAAILT